MSPVQPRKQRNPRTMALAVGGVFIGVTLVLVLFVFAIPKLTESGTIEVKLGDDRFPLGNAEVKAASIAEGGPFIFADPANGQRDIFVQHVGSDPVKGWTAFDAHRPGQGRECTLVWDGTARQFTDPCDHSTVPADGAGLPQYPVEVTSDQQVYVDLKAATRASTTTAPAPPSPSSSIQITR